MSQSEINDVVAAVESLVRRAYTLGRRDGLRHLMKYAQTDEALAKPLALLAPMAEAPVSPEPGSKLSANDVGTPIVAADESMAEEPKIVAPRHAPPPQNGGLGAMILDFVYPSKAS